MVDRHRFGLTSPVSASAGLLLQRRVPDLGVVNDDGGGSYVQASPRRPGIENENGGALVRSEGVNQGLPFPAWSGPVDRPPEGRRQPGRTDGLAKQTPAGIEVREDQNLPAVCKRLCQKLEGSLDLRSHKGLARSPRDLDPIFPVCRLVVRAAKPRMGAEQLELSGGDQSASCGIPLQGILKDVVVVTRQVGPEFNGHGNVETFRQILRRGADRAREITVPILEQTYDIVGMLRS